MLDFPMIRRTIKDRQPSCYNHSIHRRKFNCIILSEYYSKGLIALCFTNIIIILVTLKYTKVSVHTSTTNISLLRKVVFLVTISMP